MSAARARGRTVAALVVGASLGATVTAGTALLLYTGQGFLRATGLLVGSMLMAVATGLWAGAPEPANAGASARGRWAALSIALIAGGILTGLWNARDPLRQHAFGGAIAVLLALALPAYTAGSLLAALHARDRFLVRGGAAVAAGAIAGSAIGVLFSTTFFISAVDPYGIYFAAAILVAAASTLDRPRPSHLKTGESHMIDRVVVVTGAGQSGQLGWTVARRFLEAGARVVITSRSENLSDLAASLEDRGPVLAIPADLSRDDDVHAFIDHIRNQLGRIDALINVAGGLSVIATVEDTTPEEWQREIERNAGTALRMTRAALPLLRESRGAIVNFTSPAAVRAPARLAAYSAAKAAVIALTRSLAIEEKGNGVRANAIAPGLMDTDTNRAEMGDTTFVMRDDVASVAVFLASPAAAGITGETVHVLGATIE